MRIMAPILGQEVEESARGILATQYGGLRVSADIVLYCWSRR